MPYLCSANTRILLISEVPEGSLKGGIHRAQRPTRLWAFSLAPRERMRGRKEKPLAGGITGATLWRFSEYEKINIVFAKSDW